MKVLSITNQKGGTGKSTVTILLACCLASDKYKVSILDIDTQRTIKSLSELEESTIVDVYKTDIENVEKELIRLEKDKYDFVFLDFPRFTNEDKKALFLLSICDCVLVPSLGGIIEVLSTQNFIKALQKLEVKHYVFLNKYRRLKEEKETIEIKKEYNKEYAAKQTNIKISKEVHLIAKENAKKQDRNMKSYIEHLIKQDAKNYQNDV